MSPPEVSFIKMDKYPPYFSQVYNDQFCVVLSLYIWKANYLFEA